MLRLASLLVGSRALAEEIVQDSFITVGERWAAREPGRLSPVDGRERLSHGAAPAGHRTPLPYEDVSTVDAPTELVELREGLDRLSEPKRAVVVLRYFVDVSDAEIAGLLGCRTSTVRSLMRRSLVKLRKELS